jgi:hypothetical protein
MRNKQCQFERADGTRFSRWVQWGKIGGDAWQNSTISGQVTVKDSLRTGSERSALREGFGKDVKEP